jgi:hypothetical protein
MNRFNTASRLSSLALLLASSMALVAQTSESGQFSGKVTSPDNKPIAGATVLVRADKLIGDRTVKTDVNGNYRIPLLPPGEYTLTITAGNFRTQKTTTPIRLGLGAQIHQDFALKPIAEMAGAVVEVLATSAVADKADSKTSMNFSSEAMTALPAVNRGFEGGIDLSPGVTTGSGNQFGTAVIRGGKSQTAIYTLNGTSVGDDVSGMSPAGQANVYFVEDTIEDTQVVLSPLNARYGRTGSGVINMATITGGNDFSGSIRKYIQREDWYAMSPGQVGYSSASTDQYVNRNTDIVFSGPIWKDHIWFTTSTILAPTTGSAIPLNDGSNPQSWQMAKDPTAAKYGLPGQPHTWAPGTDPGYAGAFAKGLMNPYSLDQGNVDNSQNKSTFWQFKLTYAINQDHTISYEKSHYADTITDAGFNGGYTMANAGSYDFNEGPANGYTAYQYKGTLASNFFAEAIYSSKFWTSSNGPMVPYPHVREYITTGGSNGGMIWPYGTNVNTASQADDANKSAAVNFKYLGNLAGTHEVDFGFQYYESRVTTAGIAGPHLQRFYVYGGIGQNAALTPAANTQIASMLASAGITPNMGGVTGAGLDPFGNMVGFLAMTDPNNLPISSNNAAPGFRQYIGTDGMHANRNTAYYVNDSWAPNEHFNFLGGLRIERVRDTNTDGSVMINYWSSLSPRFSMKYDPKGDSSHVFSASIARFTEDITAGTTAQWVSSPGNAYVNYSFTGADLPNGIAKTAIQANQATWISYNQLTDPGNYTNIISQVDNAAGVVGLDKLRSPYIMEYTVGYRRNYQSGSFFNISYVQKEWYKDVAQAFDAYDPATQTQVQLVPGAPSMATLSNRVLNSPDMRRSYKGVEMSFEEHFTSRLTFSGSYTWSRLTGNDNGGDVAGSPYKGNGFTSSAVTWANEYYNFRDAMHASGWKDSSFDPYGPLINDDPQKARVYLTYTVPLGKGGHISYSLLGRYDAGNNFSALSGPAAGNGAGDISVWANGVNPPAGANNAIVNAAFYNYSSARGAFHQNDSHGIDFSLDFLTPLGLSSVKLMGKLQVTNIFNSVLLTTYANGFNGTNPYGIAAGQPTPSNNVPYLTASPNTFGSGLAAPGQNNPSAYNASRYLSASMGFKF